MKHFLIFIVVIFVALFGILSFRNAGDPNRDTRPVLKVVASSSFTKQWGPGPWLKEKFESVCGCRVEYLDAADSVLIMQKLKSEIVNADVVLGFDQYDLEMANKGIEWKEIKSDGFDFYENIKNTLGRSNLVPYDWGIMAFLVRQSKLKELPKGFDDLLRPEYKEQISLQDPRTSSAGLQFLFWLIQAKGEESAFRFVEKLNSQVKIYGSNWSMSYGLFQKEQVLTTVSWVTSTAYHKVEEKNSDIVAAEFSEGHPVQIEYMGIPDNCHNCDLAHKFVELVLSREGQKIIMEKNYMYPVIKNVKEGTAFGEIPSYKLIDMQTIPTQSDRERILKKWSQLRRGE